ncbi:TlpA disulfide reductase family protein [Accumulibacter sp.]|uniref:peroxiredoxin family protein n=1 Tax=Accumulibacter sp. TaxID=2053492 RepID=UPI0026335DED|nr:TlpA disulfide reductase family protein [Accumulibacter sp.]
MPESPGTMAEWQVSQWFNSERPLRVGDLRGRVVLIHAFQMLCPACVAHGLPQTQRVRDAFAGDDLAVVGLHTVFEHHAAMSPQALAAFIHEYRLSFPIGVDEPAADGPVPLTMEKLGLRGTPSTVLLDRHGRIRLHHFGRLDDLHLGFALGQLLTGSW